MLPDKKGIRLFIRLTPKASRNGVAGFAEDGNGQQQLKALVTAVPENGKANEALIKLLAKTGKWPKSVIRIISGHTDRNKVLEIEGDPGAVISKLSELTGRKE